MNTVNPLAHSPLAEVYCVNNDWAHPRLWSRAVWSTVKHMRHAGECCAREAEYSYLYIHDLHIHYNKQMHYIGEQTHSYTHVWWKHYQFTGLYIFGHIAKMWMSSCNIALPWQDPIMTFTTKLWSSPWFSQWKPVTWSFTIGNNPFAAYG